MTRAAPAAARAPDSRRASLLAAAQRVIQRRGFARATVGDITTEAGASLGLLNYYFASKEEVLAEAFAEMARADLGELEEIARRDAPAPQRLAAYIDRSEWEDRESWRMWIDAWGNAVRAEALRDSLQGFARGWRRTLAELLQDGVAEGAWACEDPHDSAGRLVAAIDGIGVQATLHAEDVTPERATLWARRLVELELGITLPSAPDPAHVASPAAAGSPVELRLPTRFRDLDAAGNVHPAALLALLEEGRHAWLAARLRRVRPRPEIGVAHMALEVERPLTAADEHVVVRCALDRLGDHTIRTTETLLTEVGAVATSARTTLTLVDPDTRRPRPLTPREREAFST